MAQSHKKEHQDYRQRQEDDRRKNGNSDSKRGECDFIYKLFFIALKQVKSPMYVFELNKDQK